MGTGRHTAEPIHDPAQCAAEGHDYNILSELEDREPISLHCIWCGAVWPIGGRVHA